MEIYVVLLIFVIVSVIFIAFIIDKIDKKNRHEKVDKNEIFNAEKDLIEMKGDCMNEYQRILTQTLSSSGLR